MSWAGKECSLLFWSVMCPHPWSNVQLLALWKISGGAPTNVMSTRMSELPDDQMLKRAFGQAVVPNLRELLAGFSVDDPLHIGYAEALDASNAVAPTVALLGLIGAGLELETTALTGHVRTPCGNLSRLG
ncbi:hypothetical protein [Clavibacter phage 33]|nr:hypothetical protein [Clavibacter phage 33]